MIKTTAVNLAAPERFMVTWDTGRRCNYDCSYCEASRHDNFSKHHSYQELLSTFNFVKEYTDIYADLVNINFTGGEPTVNPAFWDLAEHIKNNETRFRLSLTTNGAWHQKNTDRIASMFEGVTVSYHAEADQRLKDQVLENIRLLHQKNVWLQVNVMMHVDYFDECIAVCNELKTLGVKHNPRPIGDGNAERKGWFFDSDGKQRRTSHEYSTEQQQWYFDYLGVAAPVEDQKQGTELGRSCCGGRCIKGLVNNQWQKVTHIDTNFKGWFCSVNRYFLHIDQHTGEVYHHQTCQALHNGNKGPIGNLKNKDAIIGYAKSHNNETIVCPNNRCGCGMCVPKAQDYETFKLISC
jgi:MoaA/NifB/PqqE/SkfB family radical SAM enzyme